MTFSLGQAKPNKSKPNTPGTAGGPGGRDRTLAVKTEKRPKNHLFFLKK